MSRFFFYQVGEPTAATASFNPYPRVVPGTFGDTYCRTLYQASSGLLCVGA